MPIPKTKTCKDCDHCSRVYMKIRYSFRRKKDCYCTRNGFIVSNNRAACDDWTKKLPKPYDLSKQRFDEVEQDIKALMRYADD